MCTRGHTTGLHEQECSGGSLSPPSSTQGCRSGRRKQRLMGLPPLHVALGSFLPCWLEQIDNGLETSLNAFIVDCGRRKASHDESWAQQPGRLRLFPPKSIPFRLCRHCHVKQSSQHCGIKLSKVTRVASMTCLVHKATISGRKSEGLPPFGVVRFC